MHAKFSPIYGYIFGYLDIFIWQCRWQAESVPQLARSQQVLLTLVGWVYYQISTMPPAGQYSYHIKSIWGSDNFPRQKPVEQEFCSSFPPTWSPLGGVQFSQAQVNWSLEKTVIIVAARDPRVPWILMTYESMNSVRQRAYSKGRWDQCQDCCEINLNLIIWMCIIIDRLMHTWRFPIFTGREMEGVFNRTMTLRLELDIVISGQGG